MLLYLQCPHMSTQCLWRLRSHMGILQPQRLNSSSSSRIVQKLCNTASNSQIFRIVTSYDSVNSTRQTSAVRFLPKSLEDHVWRLESKAIQYLSGPPRSNIMAASSTKNIHRMNKVHRDSDVSSNKQKDFRPFIWWLSIHSRQQQSPHGWCCSDTWNWCDSHRPFWIMCSLT